MEGRVDAPADSVPESNLPDGTDLVLHADRIRVSAHAGTGLESLRTAIAHALGQELRSIEITLAPAQGATRAWLHELQAVERESVTLSGGWQMQVLLNEAAQRKLRADGVSVAADGCDSAGAANGTSFSP